MVAAVACPWESCLSTLRCWGDKPTSGVHLAIVPSSACLGGGSERGWQDGSSPGSAPHSLGRGSLNIPAGREHSEGWDQKCLVGTQKHKTSPALCGWLCPGECCSRGRDFRAEWRSAPLSSQPQQLLARP